MEQGRWHRGLDPSSLPSYLQPSAGTARRFPTSLVSSLRLSVDMSGQCLCMELLGPQPAYFWAAVGLAVMSVAYSS